MAESAARGAVLYESLRCFGCHEAERADPGVVPIRLPTTLQRHDLESLVAFLAAPTPPMPAYPLSGAEQRDLAIYLFSTRR